MITHKSNKEECPICHKIWRLGKIRKTKFGILCPACWRKNNRRELEDKWMPKISVKENNQKSILKDALSKTPPLKLKKMGALRCPIKAVEKKVLATNLWKRGLTEEEIEYRLINLEETVKNNRLKTIGKK